MSMQYQHCDWSAQGWWSGDGHQHIRANGANPAALRTEIVDACRARHLHWLCLCQPWCLSPAQLELRGPLAFEPWQADNMQVWLGGELPKTRYGHTWWLNLADVHLPLTQMSDPAIEAWYAGNPMHAALPAYQGVSPWACMVAWARAGALPVFAHPTSWWTSAPHHRFVSNLATLLPLYALAGIGPLAMVVMGYDADQIFYQQLWFHLLNAGYRVAAMAETDGTLHTSRARFCLGALRSYVWLDPATPLSPKAVRDAVAQGRTLVSSGPFIDATLSHVAGYNGPGVVVPADGARRILRICAHAAPDNAQCITHIVVYRNGHVLSHQSCTGAPQPVQTMELMLSETGNSWYVVKVYGMPGPASDATFDIATHTHDCLATGATDYAGDNHVALTSPFYFRKEITRPDPAPMSVPWPDADQQLDALLRPCYSGAWRACWPNAQPGQVPWDAFAFEKLRDALTQAAE
jgi:hypothetical protein